MIGPTPSSVHVPTADWKRKPKHAANPRTMYVHRPLLNGEDLVGWARAAGFKSTLPPDEMHVTIAFSREPVDWATVELEDDVLVAQCHGPRDHGGGYRSVMPLGDEGAIVLRFEDSHLTGRWAQFKVAGASWDYEWYQPHVTITYDGAGVNLEEVTPYTGPLILGPEVRKEIKPYEPKEQAMKTDFRMSGAVTKIDEDKQIVYGWASVYEKNGVPVVDSQGDVINEEDVCKAAQTFVTDERVGKVMHSGSKIGEVVESVVFTRELQKALGVDLGKAGWFIGMKINDDATWAKVKDGTLKAFSIGGKGQREAMEA